MSENIVLAEIKKLTTSWKRCSKQESKTERLNQIKKLIPQITDYTTLDKELLSELNISSTVSRETPRIPTKEELMKLDIFHSIELMTEVVYTKNSNALLIIGMGGVGKTETTLQTISKLQNSDTENNRNYVRLTSNITAPALYEFLFVNRHNLIVIDDCDNVLKDPVSISLLKNVMDTSTHRIVQWNVKGRNYYTPPPNFTDAQMQDAYEMSLDSDGGGTPRLPKFFEFQGSIIVISNIKLEKFKDKALLTRVSTLNVNLNREQLEKRLLEISDNFSSDIPQEERLIVLQHMFHVIDNYEVKQEVSIRTFRHALGVYSTHNGKTQEINGQTYEIWKLLINTFLTTDIIDD